MDVWGKREPVKVGLTKASGHVCLVRATALLRESKLVVHAKRPHYWKDCLPLRRHGMKAPTPL